MEDRYVRAILTALKIDRQIWEAFIDFSPRGVILLTLKFPLCAEEFTAIGCALAAEGAAHTAECNKPIQENPPPPDTPGVMKSICRFFRASEIGKPV